MERVQAEPPMDGQDLAREVTPAEPVSSWRAAAPGWSRSTPASRTRSCATCASAARRVELHPCDTGRRGAAGPRPRRGVPGQRPGRPGGARLRGRDACAAWWARCRSGASASATSCCAGRWASRPSSCPSATAAPTTRSRTWRRARSRSPRRTTASRCSGPNGEQTVDTDEPLRWETDFGAAELQQLNLYDRTVEGLVLRDVPGSTVQYHPEAGPGPARRPAPVRPLPGAPRCRVGTTSRRSSCSARARS